MNLSDLIAQAVAEAEAAKEDPRLAFERLWTRHHGRPPQKRKVGTRSEWQATVDDLSPEGRRAIWSWEPNLRWYDLIVVNSSAGKDSMAALLVLRDAAKRQGVLDRVWVAHCDLGRAEHPGTRELAQEHAKVLNLPIAVLERTVAGQRVDLLDRFRARLEAGGGFPGFGTRYCTSEFKTGEVQKWINGWVERRFGPGNLVQRMGRRARVLNVLGLRAEESEKRRGPPFTVKHETQTRVIVHEWLPIQGWTTAEVWKALRGSGLRSHPFYQAGGKRLSCRLCPLAADEDLRLAAGMYPELAQEIMALERKHGKGFKEKRTLAEVLRGKSQLHLPMR